ncbi:hypothetical protein XENTR_v10001831 [Xenopus tropicalis]|nr:hypothetical protein XENTR_v10001831 [Xenopus tropicalis]
MASNTEPPHTRNVLILSALFYAASSLLIILVNKTVLTIYRFPSSTFLGVGQMAITILILYVGKLYQIISFPDFDRQVPKKLFPLPLLYIGNHLTGLSSTQKLSLPMFTVLRKFSIPLTLILEMIILRKRFPFSVVSSVTTIIMGALIAASFDLSFNLEGYILVLLNDLFTASYGVYTKEKIDPKELGKYGVLFYNASFMILPTLIYTILSGDFELVSLFAFLAK